VNRRASLQVQLAGVPLFAAMPEPELRRVAALAVRVREATGTPLVREGERGDEFIVILEGTVEVRHEGHILATLGVGDHIGEIALVDDRARRTATVIATTPVTVAYLGRHEFAELIAESPSFRRAILTAMAARLADLDTPPR
jgi:CRP/FNR family transcriptional regulator, cyclic AMP receptor protein